MTTTLTTAQQSLVNAILRLTAESGRPPSIRELQDALGVSSPGTVHKALRKLVELGVIRRDEERRTIEIVGQAVHEPVAPVGPRIVHVEAYDRRVPGPGLGEDGTPPLWDESGVPAWV